jgi:hypothetical protein
MGPPIDEDPPSDDVRVPRESISPEPEAEHHHGRVQVVHGRESPPIAGLDSQDVEEVRGDGIAHDQFRASGDRHGRCDRLVGGKRLEDPARSLEVAIIRQRDGKPTTAAQFAVSGDQHDALRMAHSSCRVVKEAPIDRKNEGMKAEAESQGKSGESNEKKLPLEEKPSLHHF